MEIKKSLKQGLFIILSANIFAGCSIADKVVSKKEKVVIDTDEDLTTSLLVYAPSSEQAWLKKELDAFNKAHPKWKLTFETKIVESADLVNTVQTDTETVPDVYLFSSRDLPTLVNGQVIAELGGDTYTSIEKNAYETVKNTVMYDSMAYGVPYSAQTSVLYYDTRVFQKADVKSLESILQKGKLGFSLNDAQILQGFYTGNGCTIYQNSTKFDFSGDKATAVTTYLTKLVTNAHFVNCTDEATSVSRLHDGTVNAIIGSTDSYDDVVKALGEENVGFAPLPSFKLESGDVQMKSLVSTSVVGVNLSSKNTKVAVALASYLASTDAQQAHFNMQQACATDKHVKSEDGFVKTVRAVEKKSSVMYPYAEDQKSFFAALEAMGNDILSKNVTESNVVDKTNAMSTAMNAE